MGHIWKVLLIVVGLSALACSAPAAAPSGTSTGPVSGGTLRVRVAVDPWDWDLTSSGKASPNGYGMQQAYSGLLAYQSGPDVKYAEPNIVPNLAERWEASPDGKVVTFHLRQGVKFANLPPVNGRDVTAADV